MAARLDYRWHLRQVMATRGMFSTTDLLGPLSDRGIKLSSSQVYRLVVDRPERLSLKVLMGAVDLVLSGDVYVPSLLDSAPPSHGAWNGEDRPGEPWSELTRRQRDVLALISHGKSNKLIADALTMSESTVKAHVKQIIKRLRVSNRTQAALLATGHGPFPPPPVLNGGHAGSDMIGK